MAIELKSSKQPIRGCSLPLPYQLTLLIWDELKGKTNLSFKFMEPLLKNILDSWIAHCTEQLLHCRTKNNIQGIYKYTRRG